MSKSRIILTDPHGCFDTMMALIAKLPPGIPLTFAGDLIDRGPDSRKIIEFVRDNGHDCVVGNHEVMMMDELNFVTQQDGSERISIDYYHGIWGMNGGEACLRSYMVPVEEKLESGEKITTWKHDVPALKRALEWLRSLPYHILYEDVVNDKGQALLVTHTTASKVWDTLTPDHPTFKDAVTWDRVPNPDEIAGIFNVYGHTPQPNAATVGEYFACIDGGAYFKRPPYGKMFAIQFPELIIYEQENVEKL